MRRQPRRSPAGLLRLEHRAHSPASSARRPHPTACRSPHLREGLHPHVLRPHPTVGTGRRSLPACCTREVRSRCGSDSVDPEPRGRYSPAPLSGNITSVTLGGVAYPLSLQHDRPTGWRHVAPQMQNSPNPGRRVARTFDHGAGHALTIIPLRPRWQCPPARSTRSRPSPPPTAIFSPTSSTLPARRASPPASTHQGPSSISSTAPGHRIRICPCRNPPRGQAEFN